MNNMQTAPRMLAIYNVNLRTQGHLGVMRKVLAQAKAFSQNQMPVAMICGDGSSIVRLDFVNGEEVLRSILFDGVIPGDFFIHVANWLQSGPDDLFDVQCAYVRYNPMHNDELLQLANTIKAAGVALFVEMYTLEYQNELPSVAVETDEFYRQQLAPIVDAFFTPSRVEGMATFLGRPLYKMGNGATKVESTKGLFRSSVENSFYLVGVGYLARWHGYDRIYAAIAAFVDLYPSVDLRIYLVGQGPGATQLKQEAEAAGVAKWITFTGALQPQALADLYAQCHLGLGTLGFHRTGVMYAEPLKHREFMFYGLPFIYSVEDNFSNENLEGVWRMPASDALIDLISIYERYRMLDLPKITTSLQSYADQHYSWDIQTKNMLRRMIKHN